MQDFRKACSSFYTNMITMYFTCTQFLSKLTFTSYPFGAHAQRMVDCYLLVSFPFSCSLALLLNVVKRERKELHR